MDLDNLSSATKYPSILTYHGMGDRGRLTPLVQVPFPAGEPIHLTEKVDGTNGRIVILRRGPRDYIIGSREEFLFAQGDLIWNTTYQIKPVLAPLGDWLTQMLHSSIEYNIKYGSAVVFFMEVFGAGLPSAKEYTDGKEMGARIFDVCTVPLEILEKPIEQIASWRDHGGQSFWTSRGIDDAVKWQDDSCPVKLERVPSLGQAEALPTSIEATYEWLKQFEKSKCDLGGGQGRAEGVVARTADRKTIAKFRFEDYERTLGVKRLK